MRLWMGFGVVLVIFLIEILTASTNKITHNQAILVPQDAHVIILGKLQHADSFVLHSASGDRLYKFEKIEYLSNSIALIKIPDGLLRTHTDSLHGYNIKGITRKRLLHARFFNDIFQYFSAYDTYFFLGSLFIGGLAFLFAFSSIMAAIAKIDLLYLFSGFIGIALYTLALKQFQVPFYKEMSGIDLATFVLYLNIGMLLVLLNYLHKLKPTQRLFFAAPIGPWFIGLLVLSASFIITSSEWVDLFQITLLLALWVYSYINIFRFVNGFSWSFKLLIILGIPLSMVYWSTLLLDFSSNQSLFIDTAILAYFIVLASFIAEQILGEFNNSIALNLENLQLEIELGARQILSVENERKRMVQDLHRDVITRVANLANQSNHELLDYNRIEAESKATLQSLRDYSYSLYPPYLEQLTLKNILQRELDRYEYFEFEALIEINEPEANHFEPVFKLWVYRVFKEYLLGLHRRPNPQKLHLCLDFTSNLDWELRIVNQIEGNILGSPFKALSADIGIYTDYYGAVFEEIDSPVQKGWRFLKEVTEAGKEAQLPYVGR